LSVKQDFYARVFMLNIASMIRGQSIDHREGVANNNPIKHKYLLRRKIF